mmetsp:Transcript_28677/g.39976  ORF Transcript_28677/g.39976 Transcript_28677/m.39976 type:complete len:87 (+) Transcript_28677:2499-2759(+)
MLQRAVFQEQKRRHSNLRRISSRYLSKSDAGDWEPPRSHWPSLTWSSESYLQVDEQQEMMSDLLAARHHDENWVREYPVENALWFF